MQSGLFIKTHYFEKIIINYKIKKKLTIWQSCIIKFLKSCCILAHFYSKKKIAISIT